MPRQPRLESESGYYHVMIRGINKSNIFESELDKEILLHFIREKTEEELCAVYAYCIMDNHLHLVLATLKETLSTVMKKINISYAMSYNTRYKRVGHVFQDRFRSENITDERYLFGVIRYIHNNPLKAKYVKSIKDYKWSSISDYLNSDVDIIKECSKEEILKGFSTPLDFLNFHTLDDNHIYLEIKEDKLTQEREVAAIIKKYYFENNLSDSSPQKDKRALIILLLKETTLPYRRIAVLTSSKPNFVYRLKS